MLFEETQLSRPSPGYFKSIMESHFKNILGVVLSLVEEVLPKYFRFLSRFRPLHRLSLSQKRISLEETTTISRKGTSCCKFVGTSWDLSELLSVPLDVLNWYRARVEIFKILDSFTTWTICLQTYQYAKAQLFFL